MICTHDFGRHIGKLTLSKLSEGPHANKRFLSNAEIAWFLQALVPEDRVYQCGFIPLLLTAARRNSASKEGTRRLGLMAVRLAMGSVNQESSTG